MRRLLFGVHELPDCIYFATVPVTNGFVALARALRRVSEFTASGRTKNSSAAHPVTNPSMLVLFNLFALNKGKKNERCSRFRKRLLRARGMHFV